MPIKPKQNKHDAKSIGQIYADNLINGSVQRPHKNKQQSK